MSEKAAVFIDGRYLWEGLAIWRIKNVDLGRLATRIVGDHRLLRTYYYDCTLPLPSEPTPSDSEKQRRKDRFFNALRRQSRFEVRLGYLREEGRDASGKPIYKQKGADVFLAVDMLSLSLRDKIDIAFLVAGDGDFVPIVEAAKDAGVSVRLFSFDGATADQLWTACDERQYINKNLVEGIILSTL